MIMDMSDTSPRTQMRSHLHKWGRASLHISIAIGLVLIWPISQVSAHESPSTTDQLVAALLSDTPLISDLKQLTDEIGGRPTGSRQNKAAVAWGVEKFKQAGLDVHTEKVPMPRLWLEQSSNAVISGTNLSFTPAVTALTFSPATAKTGLTAPLLDGGAGMETDFRHLGPAAKDAFVLIHTKELIDIDGLFEEYANSVKIERNAHKAGVKGLIYMSSRPKGLLYRHNASLGPSNALPMAVMAREGAQKATRLLAQGTALRLTLTLNIRDESAYDSENIVAEIKGSQHPEDIFVLGAHLDSWGLGDGANDNGANAALVIDIARQMKELGITPKRTIRFVLWNGEEQGMYGSWAYIRSHRAELNNHVATATIDIGTGRILGFFTNGRSDIQHALDQALLPVAGLGPFEHINAPIVGTDNYDFMMNGIANLVANQAPYNYGPNYHASSDTFDKVDQRQLKLNATIMAAVTLGLANSDEHWARASKRDVQKLINETDLRAQMDTFNLYPAWKDGSRGWLK
jgi:hypothetical protein